MKKIILTVALFSAIFSLGYSQDTSPIKANSKKEAKKQAIKDLTPEQRGERESTHLEKELTLNADQKAKVKEYVATRVTTVRDLKEKAKASTDKTERKKVHADVKAAREKYYNDVNAILNAEQQTKWAAKKEAMMKKHEAKKAEKAKDSIDTINTEE